MRCAWLVGTGFVTTVAMLGTTARAGELDPPPGPVEPTMTTLSDVREAVEAIPQGPPGPPGPQGPPGSASGTDPLLEGQLEGPAFLFITGVPGEADEQGYQDQIRVIDVGYDLMMAGTTSAHASHAHESQAAMALPALGPLRVLARVDRSLPVLMRKLAQGALIEDVNFDMIYASTQQLLLEIDLTDAVVQTVTPVLDRHAYIVEFSYRCVTVRYLPGPQQPGGAIEFTWDVQNNQEGCSG